MLNRSFRPIPHSHCLSFYLMGTLLLLGFTVPFWILPNLAAANSPIDPATHLEDGVMVTPASPESLAMLEQARAKTNRPTGEQRLLQRSRQIAHGLEKDTGTIHTQVVARNRTLLQIHCRDDNQNSLATMDFNRATGELIQVFHRIRRERGEAIRPLSLAIAQRQSLYWLKTIGAFSGEEARLQVTPRRASKDMLVLLVRSSKRAALIRVDRRSGDLVNAQLYPASGERGKRFAGRG